MKSPMRSLLPFTVNAIAEKSGEPTIAAISGVSRSLTNAVTTAVNAAPNTTATARSTTLPRIMNCLNPFIGDPFVYRAALASGGDDAPRRARAGYTPTEVTGKPISPPDSHLGTVQP